MKRFISIILTIICISAAAVMTANALGPEPSTLTVVMEYGKKPIGGILVAAAVWPLVMGLRKKKEEGDARK